MSALQSGDLCEVVGADQTAHEKFIGGLTCILITSRDFPGNLFNPFWKVGGLPPGPEGCEWWLSHLILRKIPPAPMDDDETNYHELTA